MKIYELIRFSTIDTGPNWTSDYRVVERSIGVFKSLDDAKKAGAQFKIEYPNGNWKIRERELV